MIYSTVACTELNGSLSSTKVGINGTTTVTLKTAIANVDALIDDLILNKRVDPRYPDRYCTQAVWTGFGGADGDYDTDGDGQVIIPKFAQVAVTYQSPPIERRDDPQAEEILNESLVPTAEFINLSHKGFQWGDTEDNAVPLKADEAPGKLLFSLKLKRTWRRVTRPLPPQTLTLIGHCNSTPYYSPLLNLRFDAETLLYQPENFSRSITTTGIGAFNCDTSFGFKPQGWNKYWRSDTQQWEYIYTRPRLVSPNDPDNYNVTEPEIYRNYPLANLAPLLVI